MGLRDRARTFSKAVKDQRRVWTDPGPYDVVPNPFHGLLPRGALIYETLDQFLVIVDQECGLPAPLCDPDYGCVAVIPSESFWVCLVQVGEAFGEIGDHWLAFRMMTPGASGSGSRNTGLSFVFESP